MLDLGPDTPAHFPIIRLMSEPVEDLPASRLGTREYWDDVYLREVENLADHGDEGEVWFGLAAEKRVVDYIRKNYSHDMAMVDVGCGNGHLCFSLASAGFGKVAGLDYSQVAVDMAHTLAGAKACKVDFTQADLLNPSTIPRSHLDRFDLVVDKGTFDAICLGDGPPSESSLTKTQRFAAVYAECIVSLSRHSAHFIITSCNWTRAELETIFSKWCSPIGTVDHPSFAFGGRAGQTVTTVIFEMCTPKVKR